MPAITVPVPRREPETVRLDITGQPAQRTTHILKVVAIVALIVVTLTQLIVLAAGISVLNQLHQTTLTPTIPTPTGCPFGDLECGG